MTTAAEGRAIRTSHMRRRLQSAAETARRWVDRHAISRHTVRHHLKAEGISCQRPPCLDNSRFNDKVLRSQSDKSPFPVIKRERVNEFFIDAQMNDGRPTMSAIRVTRDMRMYKELSAGWEKASCISFIVT